MGRSRSPRGDRGTLWTRSFALTILGTFNFFASFFILLSVVPAYVDEIGGEEWQVGLVFAAFSILPLLLWPLIGLFSDRGHRKRLMMAAVAIFTLAMGLMAFSEDVWSLFALRLVQGLGMGIFPTAAVSLIGVVAPLPRRGEGVGYYGLSTSAAQMAFPALGVLIADEFGFDAVFLVGSATAASTLLFILSIDEPAMEPARGAGRGVARGTGLIPRRALFPMAIFFAVTISFWTAGAFLPLLGEDRDLGNAGLFFLAGGAIQLAVRPLAGQISDRAGRTAVIVPGLLLSATGMWVVAQAHSTEMLIGAGLINGAGFGAAHTGLFALTFDRVPSSQRGGATALLRSAWDSGGLIGGVGLGLVASALDVETTFWVTGALLVAATLSYGWGRNLGWTAPYRGEPGEPNGAAATAAARAAPE